MCNEINQQREHNKISPFSDFIHQHPNEGGDHDTSDVGKHYGLS